MNCLMFKIGEYLMLALRSIGDLENYVISVERIKEYAEIPSEV